jgi:hypothetical protein
MLPTILTSPSFYLCILLLIAGFSLLKEAPQVVQIIKFGDNYALYNHSIKDYIYDTTTGNEAPLAVLQFISVKQAQAYASHHKFTVVAGIPA